MRSATSFALQRALDLMEASASSGAGGGASASAVGRVAGLEVRLCAQDLLSAYEEIEEVRNSLKVILPRNLSYKMTLVLTFENFCRQDLGGAGR